MATYPKISGLDAALKGAEQQIYDAAYKRVHKATTATVDYARKKWPVGKTPGRRRSRDLFRIEDRSNGRDRVYLVILNDARDDNGAPYAFYIRTAKLGRGALGIRNVWRDLIRKPVLVDLGLIAAAIVKDPFGKEL
jgi:hypothetical protein